MLTLPHFTWSRPSTVDEALGELAAHPGECLMVAGGTDAVPNLKHRLHEPRRIVSLGGIAELRGIRIEDGALVVGALTTLAELSAHPHVREHFAGVAEAASLVASPQIRNMGTVGGNLCLDTRCTYYNQTFFWREALGFCLKKDGVRCHVVPQGRRCVAAHSSDVAPVWIATDAQVEIAGPEGRRQITVDNFFVGDGVHNNVLRSGEMVTRVIVPAASHGLRTAYRKLRPRAAIDFPMLGVAVAARGTRERIESLRVVVSALGAKPRVIGGLDELSAGRAFTPEVVHAVAAVAHKQCHPLINVPYDADWRRDMVPVFVKRALADAFGGAA